ncbi:MAG: prephenate dehydratase [Firmicutes bacterium]|nr:prephenate dehydratase [Bacillota bacterium]
MEAMVYLGPQGTFCEEAAKAFCQLTGMQLKISPCPTIGDCAESVEDLKARFGIVPLENSLEGSVHDTLEILTTSHQLRILAELALNIEHCLLSQAADIEEIKLVYSHPQALAQCKSYLRQKLSPAKQIPVVSTAEAAAMAAKQGAGTAAIAGRQAAEFYGLPILAAGIQDATSTTRFIVLGRENEQIGEPVKTSLVFSVKNVAGSLYRVLGAFAAHHVNLTRIESRPAGSRLGDYIFFVDLDGSLADSAVRAALREAGREAVMLKLLGSYPVLVPPGA